MRMPPLPRFLPGLGLTALIATLALIAGGRSELQAIGLAPLTLAIVLGALVGNFMPRLTSGASQAGIKFAQRTLLRSGVALYGLNLSLQDVTQVGFSGIGIDLLMVASTLALGCFVGTRWLGMDRDSALLIAAGSAICGAAAIVATVPLLRMRTADTAAKTATAVATVVLFGTLALFLYPLLFAWLGSESSLFGMFIGSTVHEVAQVVAIGNAIGGEAAQNAVIVKMIRVLLLVPFLLGLSFWIAGRDDAASGQKISIPWFALVFLLFVAINSLHILPEQARSVLKLAGIACLASAMAAFGMETTWRLLRRAGFRPLLLGAILFVHLVAVGGWINLG